MTDTERLSIVEKELAHLREEHEVLKRTYFEQKRKWDRFESEMAMLARNPSILAGEVRRQLSARGFRV